MLVHNLSLIARVIYLCSFRSEVAIPLFTWNRVTVFRTNRFGQLSVNGARPVSGQSDGQLDELNLPSIVYLGGYPGSQYNPDAGITSGFHGAIQRVSHAVQLLII